LGKEGDWLCAAVAPATSTKDRTAALASSRIIGSFPSLEEGQMPDAEKA
jgi:hypothetical protein